MSRLTRFVMVPTNPFMAGACVLGSVVAAQTAYLQVLLHPQGAAFRALVRTFLHHMQVPSCVTLTFILEHTPASDATTTPETVGPRTCHGYE
jgi:hypothetical protein